MHGIIVGMAIWAGIVDTRLNPLVKNIWYHDRYWISDNVQVVKNKNLSDILLIEILLQLSDIRLKYIVS